MCLRELFETTNETIERKKRECRTAYLEEAGREPTEQEIESWLIYS